MKNSVASHAIPFSYLHVYVHVHVCGLCPIPLSIPVHCGLIPIPIPIPVHCGLIPILIPIPVHCGLIPILIPIPVHCGLIPIPFHLPGSTLDLGLSPPVSPTLWRTVKVVFGIMASK